MTPPKKVLYVITKSNWGGAQRYVYDLAAHLDRQRFFPEVALGGEGTLARMLENADISVHPLHELSNTIKIKAAYAAFLELYNLLKRERPAVLHLNSSVAGFVGALAGRIARVPHIIFTAHGWAFNEDRPYFERLLLKILHWLTVLLSHRTIAVSHAIVREMNWPFSERKMKVINPGRTIGVMYEREEAREKIVDFFSPLSPYLADPWLVIVAELHPIKRHLILFEAFKEILKTHSSARLVCIGEGSERATLESFISEHQLAKHIYLVGSLTEAARFLKAFDLSFLISKSESYGYAIHEAGIALVPVIATNVGGILDMITHEKTGLLVPVNNVPALTDAILRLMNNPALAKDYAQSLQEHLKPRTIAHMTTVTEYLYEERST